MRKLSAYFISGVISIGFLFGGFGGVKTAQADVRPCEVYVGGMTAGFTLSAGGVQIIGLCEVMGENGVYTPAGESGLKVGDVIEKAGNISVQSITDLNEIINKNKEKQIELSIQRGGEKQKLQVKPIKDRVTGRYKIGVIVRDSVSGIGTVTYIGKEDGRFGALGHSVTGEDNSELSISSGGVYGCSIVGVLKGVRGKAGELKGMFLNDISFGKAEKLCTCGIYGQISDGYDTSGLETATADSKQVKMGKATIYSTISGIFPQEYEIEIVKVDKNNKENKNYVIKITDSNLIEQTGGIVQGMSGSPILQEGKMVGAVTHVFLNDPTRGYGIDIERMLQE